YLLTASTAIWCYRREILDSRSNLFLGGVLPGLGAAFMAFVVIYSLATGSLTGVEIAFGVVLSLFGLVLSFVSARTGKSNYYRDPRSSHGDRVEEELTELSE
ncbi:MAG: hypothetical protein J0H43_10740, partial [Actinobacteria bacterium]|nr:hypothetical protein [Actinomycetota bacterium]